MKNQIKLIACLLCAALVLSLWSFPASAERNPTKSANVPAAPEFSAQSQDMVMPVTGRAIERRPQDPELDRHFRKYDLVKIDPDAAATQVKNRGRLNLETSHGNFDLEFSPVDLRAPDYYAQEIGSDGIAHKVPNTEVNTFKGKVKGDPRAQARMSLGVSGVEGAIITGTEKFFIQPARALSKNAQSDEFVFYSAEDLADTGDETCGVTLAEEVAAREELASSDTDVTSELNNPVSPLSPMKIARIATDADAEYVNGLGGRTAAEQQILNVMNVVDGIYQVEIGITFQITFQNFWTDQNTDPYTTTDPSPLLTEFRNYWNANFTQQTRSLAHLWTGKDLNGGTIGIASVAVVCRNPTSAYGLSQRFPLTSSAIAGTAILTAHEIGHNFAAFHTNQITKDVQAEFTITCDNTIMESGLGSRTGSSFCAFSRSQIIGHINANSSCLLDSGSPAPSSPCTETPITPGVTTNGAIANSDCTSPSRGIRNFADRYTFDGIAGQQITISMDQTSGTLDPYLYLIAPDGYMVDQANFGGSGINARIPEVSNTGVFTLPQTGRYIIESTSLEPGQTGGYQLTLTLNGCVISASASTQHFPAAGGSATLNVGVSGSCGNYGIVTDPLTVGSNWILLSEGGGVGPRTFSFNVSANGNSAGRRSFILIGSSGGNSDIGGIRIPITQAGTAPDCATVPIAVGQTLNGSLQSGDCESPVRGNGILADRYAFNAFEGQRVTIQASAASGGSPDTFLTLIGPNGAVIINDDDSGGGQNSRIPGGTGRLVLEQGGRYIIEVSPFSAGGTGNYSLTLTSDAPSAIQLSDHLYSASEASNFLSVDVVRSGDISGVASVNFATSDSAGLTNCQIAQGQASERCDYATSVGTLRFAAGESVKTIVIPVINDVLAEGSETFNITLSGITGTGAGRTTATATIVDNEASAGSQNPIDGVEFFVTQQYIDFLGRLPDSVGFANWVGTLGACPNGGFGEFDNPNCDRVHVSAGFFLSAEFQGRGYFAYRFYEVALDRRPTYAEFVPDMAIVGGPQSPESEALSKATYTQAWTQRPEFKSRYDGLSNSAYVNTLEANAEVTLSNKAALIAALDAGQTNRGQVLRDIVETQAVADRFFNRAFVSMQYFGYLRRDPDTVGFNNWVTTLNNNPADFRHMIFGFLFSTEYRQRFGP